MYLTDDQRKEFEKVTEPVIKWLNENCHPHVEVLIGPGRAELLEGVMVLTTDKYIKD